MVPLPKLWATLLLTSALLMVAATPAAGGNCTPSATRLCLVASRFAAEVTFQDQTGRTGAGQVLSGSDDTGFFYFSRDIYVEIHLSILDGTAVNGHYWVFMSSVSDAQFTLTVTDTQTDEIRMYQNALGQRQVVTDTMAFPDPTLSFKQPVDPATAAAWLRRDPPAGVFLRDVPSVPTPGTSPCVPSATTLCLSENRFQVEVDWMDAIGNTGSGLATSLTSHSGTFGFFAPGNVDLLVKLVESCDFFAFAFAGTSNLEFTITLTDTATAAVSIYFNPQGTLSSVGDPEAFVNDPACVFADGMETGDLFEWSAVFGG